jgi:hypothetical protein
MDEHLSGVSMRHDGRSCPTAEYNQTAEYSLVGGGTAEFRQPAGGFGEGWCRRRQSNEGRERGICDQIVGFAYSLADRAGPSPLFSHPEYPSAPRETGDGLGSPDGWRPKSGGKQGTRGATWTNNKSGKVSVVNHFFIRLYPWFLGPRYKILHVCHR